MADRGHSEGITMSGGGQYSLATIGAKHVIDAATPMVLKVIEVLGKLEDPRFPSNIFCTFVLRPILTA